MSIGLRNDRMVRPLIMGSLYRPTYTKADPKTRGRVTRKVRKWYGKYRDATGKLRCTPLSENKTAAMAMLTDLIRSAHLQRAGLVDPSANHLARPIENHVNDFRMHLEVKARSVKHISERVRVIKSEEVLC